MTLISLLSRANIDVPPNQYSGQIPFTELDSMAILEFLLSIETHYGIELDLTAFLGESKLKTIGELASYIEQILEAQQRTASN